jgi:hypothetical protein
MASKSAFLTHLTSFHSRFGHFTCESIHNLASITGSLTASIQPARASNLRNHAMKIPKARLRASGIVVVKSTIFLVTFLITSWLPILALSFLISAISPY